MVSTCTSSLPHVRTRMPRWSDSDDSSDDSGRDTETESTDDSTTTTDEEGDECSTDDQSKKDVCSAKLVIGLAFLLGAALLLLAWWMRSRDEAPGGGKQVDTTSTSSASSESSPHTPPADPSPTSPATTESGQSRIADSAGNTSSTCFPLRPGEVPSSGAPTGSREDWWCKNEEMYGFLGEYSSRWLSSFSWSHVD